MREIALLRQLCIISPRAWHGPGRVQRQHKSEQADPASENSQIPRLDRAETDWGRRWSARNAQQAGAG